MSIWLPKALKQKIKGRWKQARRRWNTRWHAFSPAELEKALGALGVHQGDALLVHSSFDRFEGFSGKPTDVIAILQSAVGDDGAILMPTMPFSGSALDYAARNEILDLARTPSKMGLVTELFRRSPGVRRSAHPTHPVAGWGRQAEGMLAEHYRAATPCGRETPFGRLLDVGGKVLFLGARINSMTFFHTVEEILDPRMPTSPFTKELYHLRCREPDGTIRETETRLFDRELSRRRNIPRMIPALRQSGQWRQSQIGRLPLLLLETRAVLSACESLAATGVYCYDT
jgi:aminoglycoside 3-N-acetyltransferase